MCWRELGLSRTRRGRRDSGALGGELQGREEGEWGRYAEKHEMWEAMYMEDDLWAMCLLDEVRDV